MQGPGAPAEHPIPSPTPPLVLCAQAEAQDLRRSLDALTALAAGAAGADGDGFGQVQRSTAWWRVFVQKRPRSARRMCAGLSHAAAGPCPRCSVAAPCFTAHWLLHAGHWLGRCAQDSIISQLQGARALLVDFTSLSGGA